MEITAEIREYFKRIDIQEAHKAWIRKIHNQQLTPKYNSNKQKEITDWIKINNSENNITELEDYYIEFMEDYYSLPHCWIYQDHVFYQKFESIYQYCKFMFPQYEWVRTYFLDQFMDF